MIAKFFFVFLEHEDKWSRANITRDRLSYQTSICFLTFNKNICTGGLLVSVRWACIRIYIYIIDFYLFFCLFFCFSHVEARNIVQVLSLRPERDFFSNRARPPFPSLAFFSRIFRFVMRFSRVYILI